MKIENNELVKAAGTDIGKKHFELTNKKMNTNLWAIPLTEEDVAVCVGLGKYPANGLFFQNKNYSAALSCKCPPELESEIFKDGLFRLVVLLDFDPSCDFNDYQTESSDLIDSKEPLNNTNPYMGYFKGEISIDKWVTIEVRSNGSWHPTNCIALAFELTLESAKSSLLNLEKKTHEVLIAKEAEITKLMRENSSLAASFNYERAQLIHARDLGQSQNVNLMNALERFSGDTLLQDSMSLTLDLEMKQLDLEIAIEEQINLEGQMSDKNRHIAYLERLLRQNGIRFNPSVQAEDLAA